MTAKLRLKLIQPRPRLSLVWTRDEYGLVCGPLTVRIFVGGHLSKRWGVFLGGKQICRDYGYASERDARNAAPHMGAVRKLITKGNSR